MVFLVIASPARPGSLSSVTLAEDDGDPSGINLNGPTGGPGDIRGFSVYNVATIEEAEALASADPMVKAGRLVVEVHPWWLAKGSSVK